MTLGPRRSFFIAGRLHANRETWKGDATMPVVLLVRIRSALAPEELAQRAQERRSQFEAVPGLLQKLYIRDEATGEVGGLYFFASREHLAAFRDSGLAGSIAAAYEATGVRPEVFDVQTSLRPEVGPFPPE